MTIFNESLSAGATNDLCKATTVNKYSLYQKTVYGEIAIFAKGFFKGLLDNKLQVTGYT